MADNATLRRLWLARPMENTCDIEENQGEGHLMGMAIGAQVANLGDAWWIPFIHAGAGPDDLANISASREDRILPHTLIVNQRGQRFVNESTNYYDFGESLGHKVGAAPRNFPAWMIFDRQGVERYLMLALKVPDGPCPEWLTVEDSVARLAAALGIDREGLTATIDRFNEFCRTGVDLDFHRGENPWDIAWGDPDCTPNPCLGTVRKPPLYAVKVTPGSLATKGGLRVNDKGQVRSADPDLGAIPGLYAAGNCSNGAPAGAYPGPGTTIGAAMTFGYLAGRHVMQS